MAAMALITAANVVTRYLTNISLAFTEEYSVALMVMVDARWARPTRSRRDAMCASTTSSALLSARASAARNSCH